LVIVKYAALRPPAAAGRAHGSLIDIEATDDPAPDPHAARTTPSRTGISRRGR
jgi:hypothetical protein